MCADGAADWENCSDTGNGASWARPTAGCVHVLQSGNYGCKTFSLSYVHLQPLDLVRLQEGDKQPPKDLICADVFCFVRVVICSSVSSVSSYETGLSIWIYWSVQKNSLFVCINVAEYLAVCVCVHACVSIHPSPGC